MSPTRTDRDGVPFGAWATAALGAAVVLLYGSLQILGVLLFAGSWSLLTGESSNMARWATDGDVVAVSVTVAASLCGYAIYRLLARRSRLAALYLYTSNSRLRTLPLWVAAVLVAGVGSEVLARALNVPEVPESMLALYRTTDFLPIFFVAVVLVGPAFEELLFRAFLMDGWLNTRLRGAGTVLLTSLLWAAIHTQYLSEPFYVCVIAVIGLLIGWARLHTRSLLVPLVMHMVNNSVALIQLALASSDGQAWVLTAKVPFQ